MRIAYFLFICLGVIWGSNFILMKMAVAYVSPSQVVIIRVIVGFIPVVIYSIYTKSLNLKHVKFLHHFVVMSFLATSVYFYGFVKGAELLYSGIAGAVSGTIPLFSFIAAVLFLKDERFSKFKLIGCLLALVGICIIAKPFSGEFDENLILGISWMALGSMSLGLSFVYARKYLTPLKLENSALVTYQLGIASLFLLCITDLDGIKNLKSDSLALSGAVFGLGIVGTGLAYIIYYQLVRALGAVSASSVTYLPPVVALLLAVFVIGEPIRPLDYVGSLFIFSGIYVLNRSNRKKQTTA